jgi:hypothetical protein
LPDAQILAIALTVLAILGGTLINNTRIGEVKEVLRAERKSHKVEFDARVDKRESKLDRIGETLTRMPGERPNRGLVKRIRSVGMEL